MKSHPGDEQARLFVGEQAMKAKDFAKASSNFRMLVGAHPNDPFLLNNLAWSLAATNDPQALPIAEKAGALAPDNPSILDTLGWLLVEQGDADRGLTLIEKANRAAPDQMEIRLHLAKAQLKKGRPDAARATLQSVVAAAPDSDAGKASRALLATF
jgi:predicted Zn-dependent protease